MIWPEKKFERDKKPIEQNFGDLESQSYSNIPDIGFLKNDNLFKFEPLKGESHKELYERVTFAVLCIAKKSRNKGSAVIAHAETIRYAIGLTLKPHRDCLDNNIKNLSITNKYQQDDNFLLVNNDFNKI